MNEPQQAAGYHYRQVPNLYRAVADVTMEFERQQRLRLGHQRGMTWALSAVVEILASMSLDSKTILPIYNP